MWTSDEVFRKKWHDLAGLQDCRHEKKQLLERKEGIKKEKWWVMATLFDEDPREYRRITKLLNDELNGIDDQLKQIENIDKWRLHTHPPPGLSAEFDMNGDREVDIPPENHPHKEKFAAILNDLRLGEFARWICSHGDAPQAQTHGGQIGLIRYVNGVDGHRGLTIEKTRPRPYNGWAGEVTIEPAIFTERSIMFPIRFESGPLWLLRIPVAAANEADWFGVACESFKTEVLTMKTLEKETAIPVPHVFQWSAGYRPKFWCREGPHGVRFPYILMNWFEGKTVRDMWFDPGVTKEVEQQRRTKCLDDIASAMLELNKFSYGLGGRILFDENSKPSIIGSYQEEDHDTGDDVKVLTRQPYRDPRAWLDESWILGPHDVQAPQHSSQRFATNLIEAFLSSHQQEPPENGWDLSNPRAIPRLFSHRLRDTPWELQDPSEKPFVLAHPRSTANHFIVAEDGSLIGVLGWEEIMSVPRYVGNEQYPLWLTPDWNPACYHWDENMESLRGMKSTDIIQEDSPETLKHYRSVYAKAMRIAHYLRDDMHIPPIERQDEIEPTTLTTRSLLYTSLGLAVRNPKLRQGIVERILGEFGPLLSEWTERKMTEWNRIRTGDHWNTLNDHEKQRYLDNENSWLWPVPAARKTDPVEVEKLKAFYHATLFDTALQHADLHPSRAFSTLLMLSNEL